ncbi:MAG: LysM peptidoglycan-binding domain-containing protein [Clostridiales bacterium]|nr:LysM peptidoglycan-binding domain-containing protein [Clostridiales bacterium]
MIIYTVTPGDSVYSIARKYGVSPSEIIQANRLENPDALVVGQTLVIPGNFTVHTVSAGESMFSIARDYGVSLSALLRANPGITNYERLQIGQTVIVPVRAPKLGTIYVNGYAFPNISMEVLQDTLPYLTYLSIFSYQVRPDGSLITINDTPLIEAARRANVAPMMVITNIEEGASFSSALANSILTNEQVQNTLIENIISVLQSKNYFGLDVDFEYIYPDDRENYNNFMRKLSSRLRALGYILTVALAPKLSADQMGLLYEAHDYPVQGALVDHVILMTYEWGYTYGPAMAVSPANMVARVLDYAVTAIPSEKILMGMPNYGYDWTLPFVQGTAARTLSNTGAVQQALEVGARIRYDTIAQAPFYNYYDSERRRHEVWFDDARSVQARLRLVDEYNLGGVSYWTINRFFPQNWLVLDSMYDVRKVLG